MTSGKKTYAVIRAVFDNHHALADFEKELDLVLCKKVDLVIIEPEALGEVTWHWIRLGNWLHKGSVLCGFSALASAGILFTWRLFRNPLLPSIHPLPVDISTSFHSIAPFLLHTNTIFSSILSSTTACFYALFWQWDPCCKYQVASSLPRGLISLMTSCNGSQRASSISPNPCDGDSFTPAGTGSNRTSPVGSSGYNHASNGINGLRSFPLIVENRKQTRGPPLRPVVLLFRDDTRRKWLHNTLALSSVLASGYLIYQWSKST